MKITVQCTAKNERLEGTSAVADVTLSPQGGNTGMMYATGAQVGTPNAPQPVDPNAQQNQQAAIMLNNPLTFVVRDEKEAETFKVGKFYSISVNITEEKEKENKAAEKPAEK